MGKLFFDEFLFSWFKWTTKSAKIRTPRLIIISQSLISIFDLILKKNNATTGIIQYNVPSIVLFKFLVMHAQIIINTHYCRYIIIETIPKFGNKHTIINKFAKKLFIEFPYFKAGTFYKRIFPVFLIPVCTDGFRGLVCVSYSLRFGEVVILSNNHLTSDLQ